MKKCVFSLLAILISLSTIAKKKDEAPAEGFVFTDIATVPTTSVKNQNKSGTCWSFCSTSFLEDEILRQGGDSLDISEMFTVRMCYIDKADRYVRRYGETNFAGGGALVDVPYVWKKYGAMPEGVYPGLSYGADNHEHGELHAVLEAYVKAVAQKKDRHISTAWKKGFESVLDAYLGQVPETFEYKGVTYTPKSYAESLGIDYDAYMNITSFTHHPFYEEFAIEIPDNWLNENSWNVPLDELTAIIDNAISNGYPVAWAADVSEDGFKWYEGVALMPKGKDESSLEGTELARWVTLTNSQRKEEKYNFTGPVPEEEVTQESRQRMFDAQETTDDHGMEIVGIAKDQNGNKYYKVKNSWDDKQKYGGFIYVSEPYFKAKTISVYLHRDAVPESIIAKLKK